MAYAIRKMPLGRVGAPRVKLVIVVQLMSGPSGLAVMLTIGWPGSIVPLLAMPIYAVEPVAFRLRLKLT